MESDSFVREFEWLTGRAGIGMIPFLSSSKSLRTLAKLSMVKTEGRKRRGEREQVP